MGRKGLSVWIVAALVLVGGVVARHVSAASRPPGARHPLSSAFPGSRAAAAGPRAVGSWGEGSWCWFADPRAVHVNGLFVDTVVGWIDWNGQVKVGAYDSFLGYHATHVVGHLFHDDHGSPALLVEPDRRLTVFWSGHNGASMFYRTTLRPEDIRGWGPVRRVPVYLPGRLGFTYPNPVMLPAEQDKLFLFWRGADWSADFATRSLNGRWHRAGELIRTPGGQRPYVKVASDGYDTIGFAFTQAHPRDALTSIYYMSYRGGWLRHGTGRPIKRLNGRPMPAARADVVYNAAATGVSAWVWDVALDAHRDPVIVYATFPSVQRHAYWYARWTGRRWVSHFMTFGGPSIAPGTIEGQYSGGLALDHADPSVVYLSRQVRGRFEIERWWTRDGGRHWHHVNAVRTPGADDVRPVVTRGASGGPMSLLWLSGHYGNYTTYRTSVDYLR